MRLTKPLSRVAFSSALAIAAAVHAGERAPGPADPAAAVPATRYQGALPYRPAAPGPASADRNWKALNQTVAGYDSMRLTMGSTSEPAHTAAPDSAPPAVQQQSNHASHDPHAHHHGAGQ
jgi:hypothetical protein